MLLQLQVLQVGRDAVLRDLCSVSADSPRVQPADGEPSILVWGVLPAMTNPIVNDGLCRHGHMAWLDGDMYVGKSLALYGEWCEPEIEMCSRFLKPNDCVIEVGSNIGADTVPLSQLVPAGHVYAFEPQSVIYQLLCINLQMNVCRNVSALRIALGNKEDKASIPPIDYGKAENFGGIVLQKHGLGEEVDVRTLDSIIQTPHNPPISLIKADVEGMELHVLWGAARLIGNHRPAIYVENNLGDMSPHLIRHMQMIQYRCYWHTVDLHQPDNWRGHTVNEFPGMSSLNMVCLPNGDPRNDLVKDLIPVYGPRDRSPLGTQLNRGYLPKV